MPRTSRIWEYFEIVADNPAKAQCKGCHALLSRGGTLVANFTTTNLSNHLKKLHLSAFKKLEEDTEADAKKKEKERLENEASTSSSTTQNAKKVGQQTLQQSFEKGKVWDKDDPHTKMANRYLGEMIALDLQPMSIVDDIGFRQFVHCLQPKYKLPGRNHVSDKLIPAIYSGIKEGVQKKLTNVEDISVTTDMWSSPGGSHSLMSLTGHWVDEEHINKRAVLNAAKFEGRHTGENIMTEMDRMFNEWDIETKVHTVLRDNGANVVAGLNQMDSVDHQSCFIHTLQLVIGDGLKAQRTVNDTIAVGRKIAGHFRHSSLAYERLEKLQEKHKLPKHTIIQDVSTRWNSTFYMLQRINEQKDALVEFASLYDLPGNMTANQWSLSKTIVTALTPFEQLTRSSSADTATVASVIPNVAMLRGILKDQEKHKGIQTTTETMLESLNNRFKDAEPINHSPSQHS